MPFDLALWIQNEFIGGLLTTVTQRLRIDAPKLLTKPQLLSHAISETLLFDKAVKEVHLYIPRGGTEWKGCVAVFTETPEWFRAWLAIELEGRCPLPAKPLFSSLELTWPQLLRYASRIS